MRASRLLLLLFPFVLLEAGDAWARAGGARSTRSGGESPLTAPAE